jgi:hypothetical protein
VVFHAVDRQDDEVTFATAHGRTNEEGHAFSGPLSTRYPMLACAEAKGYQQGCGEPVELTEAEESEVTVALQRLALNGRVISESAIEGGRISLVDAAGMERESAAVAGDGSFSYKRLPQPGDYAVFVSRSHPLLVQRIEPEATSLIIHLARQAPGAIAVELSPSYPLESARITLAIGDLLIPADVFASHSAWRGEVAVQKGRPFVIRDVVPSAPISVLVGPTVRDRPADAPPDADLFVLPQYRGYISRRAVGADGRVVF